MGKFVLSRIFLVIECAGLVGMFLWWWDVHGKKEAINKEISYLNNEIKEETMTQQKLLNETRQGGKNASDTELIAKRSLNYKNPQETVFVFYEKSPVTEGDRDALEAKGAADDILPNPVKWWNYFFNTL